MSERAIGGYAWRNEITQANNATDTIILTLGRLLDERPGPQTQAIMIAKMALATNEIKRALAEIERISARGE